MKTQSRTLKWNDLQLRRNNSRGRGIPKRSYSHCTPDSGDRISTARAKSEMAITLLNGVLKNK